MKILFKYHYYSLFLLSFSCINYQKITKVSVNLESENANRFFESQFNQLVDRRPMFQTRLGIKKDYDKWDDISPIFEEKELEIANKSLQYMRDSIIFEKLDYQTKLSYRLYKQDLENHIYDFKYRLYYYPVNQMFGLHSEVPSFLINMHSISTKKDAQNYIGRLNGVKPLFSQLIANLKEREIAGIMPPKFVFKYAINDCKNIISGYPFLGSDSSVLYSDIYSKINNLDISKSDKNHLLRNAKKALLESVGPAYENLIVVLENQFIIATNDDGVWKWPEGESFYNNALIRTTTTEMTHQEIHNLGLREVKRIHKEMETIKRNIRFKGTLQDFFRELKENDIFYYPQSKYGKTAYMKEAAKIIEAMSLRLDELFISKPKAKMVVKAVEGFREKSAGKAFYEWPSIDGKRPGTYYANMYKMRMMPKYQMEALAYHEGIPGHHMQIAIAQELDNIPQFRRFGSYTSYTEGWGLYSEYLPIELGFYSDPYSNFGRLAMELWRACRLVVDTGIHAKKWTREQGIDYYSTNTPNDILDCVKMVERHIVAPSQATAYKIGMNKILELRNKSKKELGENFDIRIFHEVVLSNGAVPLNILEENIQTLISELKKKYNAS